MLLRFRAFCVCGAVVLGLLLTAPSYGQQTPSQETGKVSVVQAGSSEQSLLPAAPAADQTITVEELERLVTPKPIKKCGVFCGINDSTVKNCTLACGDAAFCYRGSCVFK